jgi:hypothetical protein
MIRFTLPCAPYPGGRGVLAIRRGANHQFSYGGETLEAKAECSRGLAELWELEASSFVLGLGGRRFNEREK